MYETYFQLAMAPFENTPDPRFFFASDQHNEALARGAIISVPEGQIRVRLLPIL